ncbi:MAG: hypothetical protein HC881_19685 [Leptolyngbyaceae cyanobacterium SL_7_1]|nr:hypothetical protein [Leptolyngbyaceae cyanobacterium SL_7_1]
MSNSPISDAVQSPPNQASDQAIHQSESAIHNEAVIFIPGFYAKSKGFVLENFLAIGLTTRLEGRQVELERDEVKIAGQSGRRFVYESVAGEPKTLDIYEIFWTDLVDKLSDRSIKDQIVRGFFLFVYWVFAGTWNMAKNRGCCSSSLWSSCCWCCCGITATWLWRLWQLGKTPMRLASKYYRATGRNIWLGGAKPWAGAHLGDR